MLNRQTKKILSICIKIAVLGLAFWFIFKKLSNNQSLSDFKNLLAALRPESVVLVLSSLFFLMIMNWVLEAYKWKYLIRKVEIISTWKAIESVFWGLTWAVFTPNRIGQFGGRVFFLSPRKRILGIVAMSVGVVGQMVVINVLGSSSLSLFVLSFLDLDPIMNFILGFLVIVFSSLLILFYFNIQWIDGLLSRIGFLRRYKRFFSLFSEYKTSELFKILTYCLLRVLVFTLQYYLVIHLLIPEIRMVDIIMILFVFYFIQSTLPSLDLLDIGLRATTASYFFSFVTNQEIAIMASIACIWMINLIIPAILGSVFVLKLNFFGNSNK